MLLIHRNVGLPLRLSPSRWLLVLLIHRNLGFPLRLSPSRWLLVLLIHRKLGLPLRLSPSMWLLVLLIHRNLGLPLRLSPSRWLLVLLIHRNLSLPLSLFPFICILRASFMTKSSSLLIILHRMAAAGHCSPHNEDPMARYISWTPTHGQEQQSEPEKNLRQTDL